jgi:hypothetical protein
VKFVGIFFTTVLFLSSTSFALNFVYLSFQLARGCLSVNKIIEGKLSYKGSPNFSNKKVFVKSDFGSFELLPDFSPGHFFIKTAALHKRNGKIWIEMQDLFSGKTVVSSEVSGWSCGIYSDYILKLNKNLNSYLVLK